MKLIDFIVRVIVLAVSLSAAHLIAQTASRSPSWIPGYPQRYELEVVGDMENNPAKSIIAQIPVGGRLPAGVDFVPVQVQDGRVYAAAVLSNPTSGEAMIQFYRNGNESKYWVYLPVVVYKDFRASLRGARVIEQLSLDRPGAVLPKEGLTVEYRNWAGDSMRDWKDVATGLLNASSITGNAIVTEIIQHYNPFRPADARNFAASFRGYITLPEDGRYRFFVNSDDASFVFINNQLVHMAPGGSVFRTGKLEIDHPTAGVPFEIKKGTYPVEVHQVVGNSSTANPRMIFIWAKPNQMTKDGDDKWDYVPTSAYSHAMMAVVNKVEQSSGRFAPVFTIGQMDTLETSGVMMFLVHVQAHGDIGDGKDLKWDMGDGTVVTGKTGFTHLYLSDGVYEVTLSNGNNVPLYKKTIAPFSFPSNTNPNSLSEAVKNLESRDMRSLKSSDLRKVLEFLRLSHQRNRWELQEKVANALIDDPTTDIVTRAVAYSALAEAMGHMGKAREGVDLLEGKLTDFKNQPGLIIQLRLRQAALLYGFLKDLAQASSIYDSIIEEYKYIEDPNVRLAAIHWGDMLVDSGDYPRAASVYRKVHELGVRGDGAVAGEMDNVREGAQLRMAELSLRRGDIRGTRQILRKIEQRNPEQRMEVLSRFLIAETDRLAGRYDDAMRGYEYLLAQRQGVPQEQVLRSLADTAARKGDYDVALSVAARVKEMNPDFYEKQKMEDFVKFVTDRKARIDAGEKIFTSIQVDFNPQRLESMGGKIENSKSSWGLGVRSRVVGMQGPSGDKKNPPLSKIWIPVRNVEPDGLYWIDITYRENYGSGDKAGGMRAVIYDVTDPEKPRHVAEDKADLPRTFGQWYRQGMLVRARGIRSQDGLIEVRVGGGKGIVEIDSVRVERVDPYEEDALQNFVDGYISDKSF
jgi:tetratricopeptide (TPR) repeat protein